MRECEKFARFEFFEVNNLFCERKPSLVAEYYGKFARISGSFGDNINIGLLILTKYLEVYGRNQ